MSVGREERRAGRTVVSRLTIASRPQANTVGALTSSGEHELKAFIAVAAASICRGPTPTANRAASPAPATLLPTFSYTTPWDASPRYFASRGASLASETLTGTGAIVAVRAARPLPIVSLRFCMRNSPRRRLSRAPPVTVSARRPAAL